MSRYKTANFVAPEQFRVYVIDVDGDEDNDVYVGQTWHTPEQRREQHLAGVRRGRVFKRRNRTVGALRPDLVPALERLSTREAAVAAEGYVAAVLRSQGFIVYGGH